MARKAKEDVKLKILETAEALFAQRGFDATGIDLIAKTAGITKSLIYYYFKSKDEILSELFQNFVLKSIEMKKQITQIWAETPGYDIEKIIKDFTLPFMISQKDIIRIAFTESVKEAPITPHINIFKYFDQNFQAGFDIADEYGIQVDKDLSNLSGFFLFFAPLFSFVIFSDEWCEYYQCDLKSVTGLFAAVFGKMYNALVGQRPANNRFPDALKQRYEK